MQSGSAVLGLVGFAVSLTLAAIKLWETFWQKPRFVFDFRWFASRDSPDIPNRLEICLTNVGRRKGTVRELLVYRRGDDTPLRPGRFAAHFPATLESGDLKVIHLRQPADEPDQAPWLWEEIVDRTISTLVAVDTFGKEHIARNPKRRFLAVTTSDRAT